MPDTIDALFAFIFAGAAVWTLVPATESLARRIGDRAIDFPNERSLHDLPTPKLGGLAVLVAVLIGGSIFLPWDHETRSILAGAIVITAVGVIDDLVDLPAGVKLLGQTAAAIIPVASGVTVDSFTLPFLGRVDPGSVQLFDPPGIGPIDLGQVLTVIGIVAVANVINLIDGVDGLAAGVCLISAAALAVIALSLDRNAAGVLAAVTAGASLGFLRHGFPPASSFMGDTGSNLLGYLMAVVTVQGALKTNAVVALFFPLAILAVPILDTSFVVAKRVKYGRAIYRADMEHFHHRMARIGFSPRRTIAYLYGWTLILAGVALALRFVPYTDNHGHFRTGWTIFMAACLIGALVASIYVIQVLEILKMKGFRRRQVAAARSTAESEVEEGVLHELDTGTFAAVDPATGEMTAIDPDTGEIEPVTPQG
ncbi:MAG TPA: MraY family glycosyltransferase [Solirubrobacterales bacterium]|nr:MraY family glycosyltransferase [Solirubrobacterales bacterium]